ncbi:MAG: 4-hydroxy-3-methylbut-2-enyl diphosphate reductase [Spirochaetes bacterium]|nr:4-hydroxy-3-methylbut-2-enyl diphosphate reductase [Spirochaetota bacterium]
MIVIRAKTLGMCMGVRKAEAAALKAAAKGAASGKPVLTYGPLIHNPQAVAELEKAGVSILDPEAFDAGRLDRKVSGSIVILRAHGAPPQVFQHLAAAGAEVVDATCPRVLKSQRKARELRNAGWSVAIAGDRSHDEVAGILGCAPGSVVVQDSAEAGSLASSWAGRRVALIAQTTIKRSEYDEIASVLALAASEFLAVDSLCPATLDRQRALAELAGEVDALVVVGGRNSANTQRLFMSAKASGKPAWHIETALELSAEVFGFARVGLSAGASTPDSLVEEVEARLYRQEGPC